MTQWLDENSAVLLWTGGASIVLLIASVVAAPFVLVRLPPDYLQRDHKESRRRHPALNVARNIAGWLLILAGIAMLILPGQGALVLVIGVMLANFPGKHRLQRWLLTRPRVFRAINWIRGRFHRPPLQPA